MYVCMCIYHASGRTAAPSSESHGQAHERPEADAHALADGPERAFPGLRALDASVATEMRTREPLTCDFRRRAASAPTTCNYRHKPSRRMCKTTERTQGRKWRVHGSGTFRAARRVTDRPVAVRSRRRESR
jgi:hypothetical protein